MNRITLITLAVEDISRAVDFYSTLGWKVEEQLPLVAFFDMGGLKFGLYQVAHHAEDLGVELASLGTGRSALSINFSSEAEVDAAFALATAAGGKICQTPRKVFWGGYSGLWRDLDGHVWEYSMNPFWPLDKSGWLKKS